MLSRWAAVAVSAGPTTQEAGIPTAAPAMVARPTMGQLVEAAVRLLLKIFIEINYS